MKTTDTFLVEIIDTGMDGEGVARIEDIPVFIPFAAKGDLCKIKIERVNKSYAFARLVKVVRPSESRVLPVCPIFGECGGCALQHIDFAAENEFKSKYVAAMLKKAGIEAEVADCVFDKPYEYRNKLQMPFAEENGRAVLGFFRRGTHEVIPTIDCPLHAGWAKKLIEIVAAWANGEISSPPKEIYNETEHKGLLRHLVARYEGGFLSVAIVINGNTLPAADELYAVLSREFECNLYVSANTKRTSVILGDTTKLILGREKKVEVDGLKLVLQPQSFLQVNDEIRRRLYGAILNAAADSDIIFDIYSGAGVLTAMLAKGAGSKKSPAVYGVEIVPEAVAAADRLMADSGLKKQVKNICADAAKVLPNLVETVVNDNYSEVKPRVCIVLDPPRKGCDSSVIEAVISSCADKVIYVSCNPATLIRDLKLLGESYVVVAVNPFNMFPRTPHVECVVLMSKVIK